MSQHKMNIQDIIFLMVYIFVLVYLFIKILMTSCFVCATLNLGRKKSAGTEPYTGQVRILFRLINFLQSYASWT